MPINKNAQIRYNALDRCFRNTGKKYFIDDLLEECNNSLVELNSKTTGIQRRQIFDDIKFMESDKGFQIELDRIKDGRKTYYRYKDTTFSINNQPINEKEANQLKAAFQVMSRFEGLPQFEWVYEIKKKLETSFQLEDNEREVIGFESNVDLVGLGYLSELFDAVFYEKVLHIRYKSFLSEEENQFELHPYYLKQYNNRWFLLGQDERFDTLTVIALDRILCIKEARNVEFIPNLNIDFKEYFDDFIGVSKLGDETIVIKFWVHNSRAPYVETKPLHCTQKKLGAEGEGTLFSIDVIPNKELETQLLSFGEDLYVLSPSTFRERMKERVIHLFSLYQ
ncbi:YafY family protein [Flammeovirga sp. SJP92]|uniref:helix-turn-helix transcriptional regulator n=1 Tax=Flammeovirga sp. SJP92 TaxID=1775430 RepID=UPI00078941D4|nr:WYL domain-containing protein [Flammeovirga sp. SJP92]KXX66683.1 transcriptional regulator [Flammeovirga sp. SJP92]